MIAGNATGNRSTSHRRPGSKGAWLTSRSAAGTWSEVPVTALRYCTTLLLPSVEPPIGAPSGSGRPAVGMPSRCSSARIAR